ncbi:MAG: TIGR04283 family arsenosugar biosynthesis glycosyltransferase [Sporichthyaceae bacterium]
MPNSRPRSVSIVVPVLDEAPIVAESLSRLRRDFPDCELVVVDGGSRDGTADLARPFAPVVLAERGRARQLNAGAAHCSGEVLWFVHVDTAPDPAALAQLRAALADPRVLGGGLRLRFDRRSPALNFLAWSSNLRARRLHLVFGDQAMFVRRDVFDALGGFPDLALMEDLELSRRLARRGRLAVLPAPCVASARRLEAQGTWRMIGYMQYLKVLYLLGADPAGIERRYACGPPRPARLLRRR